MKPHYAITFKILEQDHQPTMLESLKECSAFQLLVATLLSARSKDSTVIPIVRALFQKYPSPEDFIAMPVQALEQEIYKIGFYRVKAKHIKELSRIIVDEYNGIVPDTLEKLTSLPGVGRKTANCMLSYVFKKPAIAVDIHVHRISNRLGWVKTRTAQETEEDLQRKIPVKMWSDVNRLLVDHGQRVCLPIKPRCSICKIRMYCEQNL